MKKTLLLAAIITLTCSCTLQASSISNVSDVSENDPGIQINNALPTARVAVNKDYEQMGNDDLFKKYNEIVPNPSSFTGLILASAINGDSRDHYQEAFAAFSQRVKSDSTFMDNVIELDERYQAVRTAWMVSYTAIAMERKVQAEIYTNIAKEREESFNIKLKEANQQTVENLLKTLSRDVVSCHVKEMYRQLPEDYLVDKWSDVTM